jgi:hypothetical protein
MSSNNGKQSEVDFVERVRVNQQRLRSNLKSNYDFMSVGQVPLVRWWRAVPASSSASAPQRPCGPNTS